jgi:hypothetical protein
MTTIEKKFFVDPKLPHLSVVTDPMAMASVFAKNFHPMLSALGWQVENCALERVQHHRGRLCRLLYRITLRDANGKRADHWFFGDLVRQGSGRRKFEEAQAKEFLSNGIWQAVNLWPDLEMVVRAFPNDPEMSGLLKAVDPAFVRSQINANISAFGLDEKWQCERVDFVRVKYMPGKRCVLRCHARLIDPAGESRDLAFYSKTYRDGISGFHYQVLKKAYDHFGQVVNIPRPVTHLDEAHTFWQEPWEGRPLIDMLEELDWEKLFPRLAGVVAAFHHSHCPDLPPADGLDKILASAEDDARKLAELLPQYRPPLDAAVAALAATKEILAGQNVPVVPLHGAIRIEQIVAREDEVALVDFDAASLGDPLADVTEFLTSLQYLEFSHGFVHERLSEAAALFKTSYQKQVSWRLEPRRMAWYAVAFLIGKMYGSMKHLDRTVLSKFDSITELMESWISALYEPSNH